MNTAQFALAVLVFMICTTLIVPVQRGLAQSASGYVCRIETDDAKIDKSLPTSIRSEDEDWGEEQLLESVSVDLNSDGINEKLVPNKYLAGSGGCPWVLYDSTNDRILGRLEAGIIYIQTEKSLGYAVLECFWKTGDGEALVIYYSFNGRRYEAARTLTLSKDQIEKYFDERKGARRISELRPVR